MIYVTSDLHFGSENKNLIELGRPFKSLEVCENTLINNINETCTKDDILYVVGDYFNCSHNDSDSYLQAIKTVRKINAQVLLILGNNEMRLIRKHFNNNFTVFRKWCMANGFMDVKYDAYIDIRGKKFFLTHSPSDSRLGVLNLFGHVHKTVQITSFGINCFADLYWLRPLDEDTIFKIIRDTVNFTYKDEGFLKSIGCSKFPRKLWKSYLT